jgi:predicted O-linked N-acetylglucosamine transferase (SPINDLY family)
MRQRVVKAFDHHVMLHKMTDEEAARQIRALEIDVLIDLTGLTASSRWPILAYRAAPVQVSYLGFPGVSHIPGMTHVMVDRVLMPRVLKRVPDAVLWMTVNDEGTRERLHQRAADVGVQRNRLVFASKVVPELYLARLQCADVFLDTRPFGAGTTASDALWAGLPVLTCPGQSYASRMAASLLTAMGVQELIAPSLDAYEEMAVALGTDSARLDAVKQRVRQARTESKLFDTPAFVADLEAKLMQVCGAPSLAECG